MSSASIIPSLCQGLLDVENERFSIDEARNVVRLFISGVQDWYAKEPIAGTKMEWFSGESTKVTLYDVATQGASLHIPLHRALSSMLAESGKEWSFTLFDLIPLNDTNPDHFLNFISALLEGPLRAQVSPSSS